MNDQNDNEDQIVYISAVAKGGVKGAWLWLGISAKAVAKSMPWNFAATKVTGITPGRAAQVKCAVRDSRNQVKNDCRFHLAQPVLVASAAMPMPRPTKADK
ncbi:MAG: hypothetical protein U0401_34320 [Anaerolineae bacterium]